MKRRLNPAHLEGNLLNPPTPPRGPSKEEASAKLPTSAADIVDAPRRANDHVAAVLAGRMPVACLEAFIPTDVITALHMLWSLRKDKTTYEYPSWKTNH